MQAVEVSIVAAWFASGLGLGALVMNRYHKRKGLGGQVRKMKWIARRDWFFEEQKEYRAVNGIIMAVMFTLIAATWLFFFAAGLSPLIASAWSTLLSSIFLGVGLGISFFVKEDM